MKKILKIQAFILLLLIIVVWINKGNPDSALMVIVTLFIAPIMLFSSHYWGIEIYSYAFLLVIVVLSLMIYGYKQRNRKRGIIAFTIGFWFYAYACLLFVGMNF